MKFPVKAFLFLGGLNLFLLLPVLLFLEISFLIPAFVLLLIFNLFLYFFPEIKLKNCFSMEDFPPDDFWEIQRFLEDMKSSFPVKKVHCYKTKHLFPFFFCFGNSYKSYIVFSESFLDIFGEENRKQVLNYCLHMVATGETFFLTLLSAFLFLTEKFLRGISLPLQFFNKQKRKINILMIFILKVVGWITRPVFYRLDRLAAKKEEEKQDLSLFLWKLQALYEVQEKRLPLFLIPLFPVSPLTDSKERCYINLQPQIRPRVKALIKIYPP